MEGKIFIVRASGSTYIIMASTLEIAQELNPCKNIKDIDPPEDITEQLDKYGIHQSYDLPN